MHLSPLRYPGGKSKFSKFLEDVILLNNLEDRDLYELYAGGAGASLNLLDQRICTNIFLNDFDYHIFAFWHSVLNHSDKFIERIREIKVDLNQWKIQKQIYDNVTHYSSFDVGFSTFFLNRTNRSGILQAGPIGGNTQDGKYLINARFNKENLIKRINRITEQRCNINITNLESIELIDSILERNQNNPILFLDPPYFKQGENLYLNFYKKDDHLALAQKLENYKNKNWILTYDNCDEILQLYKGFRYSYLPMKYSLETKREAKEIIIFSDALTIPQNISVGTYKNRLEVFNNE